MKTLTEHINEALKIGKDLSGWSSYSCQPKDKEELQEIIKDRISKEGPECNLNDIDTSLITDMSWLFEDSRFNGDISNWNVSNVKNMKGIFKKSDFNGDISEWDVSNVEDMSYMFSRSNFNGDISKWNVRNVTDMSYMFYKAKFNGDISRWNIDKDCKVYNIFDGCPIKDEYKPKSLQQ